MRGKKGGSIAEAAIVFPVVVISVVTMIYILITMYSQVTEAAHDHIALRQEAGIRTATCYWQESFFHLSPADRFGRRAFKKKVMIGEEKGVLGGYLFSESAKVYLIDEESYVRKIDLIAGIWGEGHEKKLE